jgi:RNA polymerase subunit RPABC4/transcription elongation factor Spt4
MGGNVKEYYSRKPKCAECRNKVVPEEDDVCLRCRQMKGLGEWFRDVVENLDEYSDKEIGRTLIQFKQRY